MDKNIKTPISEEKKTTASKSSSDTSVDPIESLDSDVSSDDTDSKLQQTNEILSQKEEERLPHITEETKNIEKPTALVSKEDQDLNREGGKSKEELKIDEAPQPISSSQEVETLENVSETNTKENETSKDLNDTISHASDIDESIDTNVKIQPKESTIDLDSFTEEELVSLFEKTINDSQWNKQRNLISTISNSIKEKFQNDFETRKESYIQGGGNQIDFYYHPEYKKQFDRLTRYFQKKKRDYYRNLEKDLQSNLNKKRDLIHQIKELRSHDISIKNKYNQIQNIQDQWYEIGPVPRMKSDQLWKDYNHNLDLFYQLLDVHKTQRDEFDQQHFEKLKLLIEESREKIQTLELGKGKHELETLKTLLQIKSGRLSFRLRNDIWNQFRTVRKELDKTNEQIKIDVLNELRTIHEQLPTTHEHWQKCNQNLNQLNAKFRDAHPVSYKTLKKLNTEFYELYWDIIRKKNAFYKEFILTKKESFRTKVEIINELETILDSDDWKEKVNRVKQLRQKWKKIGYTSNKNEKKIWSQFNKLNKLYFTRMQQGYEKLTPHQESIEKAKKDFIKEVEEGFDFDSEKDLIKQLNPKIELWHGFGSINPDTDYQLNHSFYFVISQKIKFLELTKKEKSQFSFECLLEIIKSDNHSIKKNMIQIKTTTNNLIKELTQLENNLQFFDTSSSSSPLVLKTEEKSIRLKKRLEFYQERYSRLQSLMSNL
ncbi:MAG: DUF349 domain-containing protein [Flavobacteriaceae bacterium]|nr:DUF349 domain-containing protein [Flavobacteriaceae bacterium]